MPDPTAVILELVEITVPVLSSQLYTYPVATTPPFTITEASPLLSPQAASVEEGVMASALFSVTSKAVESVQPSSSVTTMEY